MTLRRAAPAALLAVLLSVALAPVASAETAGPLPQLPGQVLADLNGSERAVLADAVPERGEKTRDISIVRTVNGRMSIDSVEVAAGDASSVERVLDAQPSVAEASLAQPIHAFADPRVADQWALPLLKAAQVRTAQGSSTPPVVAVIDTGIDVSHPDLDGVLVSGYNAITHTAGLPVDVYGHGTHVSGIIGAEVGNGIGVEGLLSNVRIMPVKALSDDGSGSTTAAAAGVVWAADHGADVINMSLGGPTSDPALQSAVQYADGLGVVVVAAMGNEFEDGNPTSYPAAYSTVLAVGATDVNDAHGVFSNTGPHIDVAAPGVQILSTCVGSTYCSMSGTSMATPYAAAVAAAVVAKYPTLTPAQVRSQITLTADDLGTPGFDQTFGYGLVDPFEALTTLPESLVDTDLPSAPTQLNVVPGDRQLSLSWGAPVDAGASAVSSYLVTVTPQTGAPTVATVPGLSTVVTDLVNGGEYLVSVQATNADGTGQGASQAGRPRGLPLAPPITVPTPGNRALTVSWGVPTSDGGSPVTGFRLYLKPPTGAELHYDLAATARSASFSGLVNGTRYALSVQAQNAAGYSPRSASVSVVPRTVTSAPYLSSVTPGSGRAVVAWSAPTATNGAAVTSYRIVVTRSGYATRYFSAAASLRKATITGLTNGALYGVRVQALNAAGYSAYSRTLSLRPRTVTSAPRSPRLKSGSSRDHSVTLTASWTAPSSTGGAAVTSYVVRLRKVGSSRDVIKTVSYAHRSLSISKLSRSGKYTITVQARNAAGSSALSQRSSSVAAR